MKWLLATCFCGGFSTFSTFSNETLTLIKTQQWVLAAVYVGLSIFLGLLALALGAALRF
jgi:CrcB protein